MTLLEALRTIERGTIALTEIAAAAAAANTAIHISGTSQATRDAAHVLKQALDADHARITDQIDEAKDVIREAHRVAKTNQ